MACGYEGYEFGGGYIDAVCIDGYLWDLDSCDEPGGGLTRGGEWACPRCNTKQMLEDAIEEAKEGSCGKSMTRPWVAATVWESSVLKAIRENRPVAEAFLSAAKPFVTIDWPDRKAVYEGRAAWDNTVDRTWPWPLQEPSPVSREDVRREAIEALNGAELFEIMFNETKGAVPAELTDEILERVADGIKSAFGGCNHVSA